MNVTQQSAVDVTLEISIRLQCCSYNTGRSEVNTVHIIAGDFKQLMGLIVSFIAESFACRKKKIIMHKGTVSLE